MNQKKSENFWKEKMKIGRLGIRLLDDQDWTYDKPSCGCHIFHWARFEITYFDKDKKV
jgi:hypothetical protein